MAFSHIQFFRQFFRKRDVFALFFNDDDVRFDFRFKNVLQRTIKSKHLIQITLFAKFVFINSNFVIDRFQKKTFKLRC